MDGTNSNSKRSSKGGELTRNLEEELLKLGISVGVVDPELFVLGGCRRKFDVIFLQ